MSGNHNDTRNHNLDVLTKDLGLTQLRNSTIFEKADTFVLSPSVQNDKNWFDLRAINLKQCSKGEKAYLLIRLLDGFILEDLDLFSKTMFDKEPYNTSNSGMHWKFQIRTKTLGKLYILNMKSKAEFEISILQKEDLIQKFK